MSDNGKLAALANLKAARAAVDAVFATDHSRDAKAWLEQLAEARRNRRQAWIKVSAYVDDELLLMAIGDIHDGVIVPAVELLALAQRGGASS